MKVIKAWCEHLSKKHFPQETTDLPLKRNIQDHQINPAWAWNHQKEQNDCALPKKSAHIEIKTEGGDNYQYYQSKNILKKGRKIPISIHHRRGEFGAFIDDIPERPLHNRSSIYYNTKSKASTRKSTNLNKTFDKVDKEKVLKSVNETRGVQ